MAYTMSDQKGSVSKASSEMSKAMNDASDKVNETVDQVKKSAAESFDKVETAIRRNPLAAASIAGGLGFFLAVLARR